ncbi:hypothetical protein ABK040_014212 [Willaertia magna]
MMLFANDYLLSLEDGEHDKPPYKHRPVLRDFSFQEETPPKHIVEAQKSLQKKLASPSRKRMGSVKCLDTLKENIKQTRKTKEKIKKANTNDVMQMIRIIKGPENEMDDTSIGIPTCVEPPPLISQRSDSSLTYITASRSSINLLPKISNVEIANLIAMNEKDELLPPKRKIFVLEKKISKLKELKMYYHVIDLRIMVIALVRMLYGSKSCQYAEQLLEMGTSYLKIKAYEQAFTYLKKSLLIITQIISKDGIFELDFEEDKPDNLENQLNESVCKNLLPKLFFILGKCYLDQGQLKLAHSCLKEAKEHNEKLEVEMRDSSISFDINMQLANLFSRISKFENALQYLIMAWEVKMKEVGSNNHPDIAVVYREMAQVHFKNETFVEAIENYVKAASVYDELGGPVDLFNSAVTSCTIGNIYFEKLKDLDKAMEYYTKAVKGVELYCGPYDKKTIKVYQYLARCVLEKHTQEGNTENQRNILEKACTLYREILKRQMKVDTESQCVATNETLGDIYFLLEDYGNALLNYERGFLTAEELFGPNNTTTTTLQSKLQETREHMNEKEDRNLHEDKY